MSINVRIVMIIFALFIILLIINLLKKDRVPIKISLLWLFAAFLILFIGAFPECLKLLLDLLGFKTLSNMLGGILLGILFVISISLTVVISGQKAKSDINPRNIIIKKTCRYTWARFVK